MTNEQKKMKKNATLKNVNVDNLIIPKWLYELKENEDFIESISDIKLLLLSEISSDTVNPGRDGAVKRHRVEKIVSSIERDSWIDGEEVCVVIKISKPDLLSTVLYEIYFTLHRHGAAVMVQNKYGIPDPVLPSVVVTLKPGLSKIRTQQIMALMADIENDETDKKPKTEYTPDDRANAWMSYVVDYIEPEVVKTTSQHKLNYIENHYITTYVIPRGVHTNTIKATLKIVKEKLQIFTPMVKFNTKALRTEWTVGYKGQFEYCMQKITNINLNVGYKKLQRPFGNSEEKYVVFWKEGDENRDVGDLLLHLSQNLDDQIRVPVMVFLDCANASGYTELPKHRSDRVAEVERLMRYLPKEITELVHFVGFLPHARDEEDMSTFISFSKIKNGSFNKYVAV